MNISKKVILPAAVAVSGFVGIGGATLLASLPANAATAGTSSTSSTNTAQSPPPLQTDPSKGGHVANGITETVLTGDTATKATAAAEAAEPGATIIRVENDAEGATYEAHMTKSDGTTVTVKMDSNFKVTSTESGFGGGAAPAAPSPATN